MPELDDVRGPAAALVHFAGMSATIVGVPLLVARRLAGDRTPLVAPAAIAIGVGLTIATRRTAWSLVKLWLGIGLPRAPRQRTRSHRGPGPSRGRQASGT